MQLREKYSNLPWKADDKYKDTPKGENGATVHSSFHLRFWNSADDMSDDIPTPGLAELVEKVREAKGDVVFISGRWSPEMYDPSRIALKRAGIRGPINIEFGNLGHRLSDADAKKELQQRILKKYGKPVACIDDRTGNLDATAEGFHPFVKVISRIPGYTSAPLPKNSEDYLTISTFSMEEPKARNIQKSI